MIEQTATDEGSDRAPWLDESVARCFAAGPGYLNSATVGLPPRDAVQAVRARLDEWERGDCHPPSFEPDIERARRAYATVVGATPGTVGLVGQVSVASGMVAASLPAGARVLCAEEDFTSVLFPFLADDRLDVRTVPLAGLLDAVRPDVDLVAVSAVQSADGRVIDLDALAEAAADAGARTYVDLSQAAGWLTIGADRFDVTACGAYKWLCSPRGSGFVTVGADNDWLRPVHASWHGGDDPWESLYGPPLRLSDEGRRFDASPAWFDLVGAARSIELLAEIGTAALGAHGIGLANRFRERLELPPGPGAIVSIDSDRGPDLAAAGITAAERAGRVRLGFHLYNTVDDVDRAAAILTGP